MEHRNIIIILLIVIAVLSAAIGATLMQNVERQASMLFITSNGTLDEGEPVIIKLTDSNRTPLSGQKVNVNIFDNAGNAVINRTLETNSNGGARLDLELDEGNYTVNAIYAGNENYTGNATAKDLTIKRQVVQASVSSSLPYSINNLPASNDPNPETNRYQIDEYHVRQDYSDNYFSVVDLRTGERHGGFY